MSPIPIHGQKSNKNEFLPSSTLTYPPPHAEKKSSKWNYLAFAVLGLLALIHAVNRAGFLPKTLAETFGSSGTDASIANLCPQERALYPHKEYALFQALTGNYGTEQFKARAIEWVSSLR